MTPLGVRTAVLRHVDMVPGAPPEFLDEWLNLPTGTAARILKGLHTMGYKGTDTCLFKAADDEPIFVLRAADLTAPTIVRAWAREARLAGAPQNKVQEAMHWAEVMEEWAHANGAKVPD